MLSDLFSTIDLFGVPVIINYCGKEKLKTRFGGVCTVFFFLFMVWAIYDSSQDMFLRKRPTTSVSSQLISNDPKEMSLNSDNFPIAFSIQAPNTLQYSYFANESIFSIEMFLTSVLTTQTSNGTISRQTTTTQIYLEKCRTEHFGKQVNFFTNFDWNTLYCLSLEKNPDILIVRGGFFSSIYKTIRVVIYECNSKHSSVPCASEEVRKQYLEGAWFNVIYANMVINPNDYENPDTRYQETFSKPISRSITKSCTMFLSHVYVNTDSGYLSESSSTKHFIYMSSSSDNSFAKNSSDPYPPLIAANFEVNKNEFAYTRSYKKIPTVLAEVGSLSSTVLMIVMLVMSPYLKLRLRETLINQLFNIDMDLKEEANQQIKQVKEKKLGLAVTKGKKKFLNERLEIPSLMIERGLTGSMTEKVISNDVPKQDITSNDKKPNGTRAPKKSSHANMIIKSLDQLKEIKSRKNSLIGKPVKAATHYRISSWRDQCEKIDLREKCQKAVTMENNTVSLLSLDTQRKEYELNHSLNSIEKKEHAKSEMKVFENQALQNREESILFVLDSHRAPKSKEIIKEKDEKIPVPLAAIEDNNYNIEDKNEEEGSGSSSMIEDKIHNVVQRAVIIKPRGGSEGIRLSVWEYLLSFFYKPKALKRKMHIIETGSKNIIERLDVLTILQKMREIDKMRTLLFDRDQLMLYNNLPKPEIFAEKKENRDIRSFRSLLTKTTLFESSGTEQEVKAAYKRLALKEDKTELDERILGVFQHALE